MLAVPIGVLLDRSVLRAAVAGRATYENVDFYRRFARPGVCFFTFDGIDLKRGTVLAYVFDREGRLVARRLPLPRVVHYRAIAFAKRDRRLAAALMRRPGLIVFNHPRCGGKLRNALWLAADPTTRAHVPETLRYDGPRALGKLLSKYPAVILKPIWGSLGKGLIRVRRAADGYTWETGRSPHPHFCCTLTALARRLSGRIGRRPYLVQRALELAHYRGHPFDVRVSVQRGGDGEWRVAGMVAKVAGRNRIATNVARGGRAVNLSGVLNEAFGPVAAGHCTEALSELGLRAAAVLSRHERGMADYGFDLCLTGDGHPWFLEANHRDLRYAFRDSGDHDLWANTYRNPMEYAAHLLATGRSAVGDSA